MNIEETLEELFTEYGVSLLVQPLRIEGFLKDLHPEESRAVFLLCEALFSGMVAQITKKKHLSERERQNISLQFVERSGISVRYACWAIDTWVDVLPLEAYTHTTEKDVWKGTLEEVLHHTPMEK